MAEAILQTHGLTKKYGDFTALDRVSLTLKQGDIYGLVGRNGAGKTTLFKCIMGIAEPAGGTVEIFGDGNDLNKARSRMGFMINPSFFSYLNARENLSYLCRVKGIETGNEIEKLLRMVELDGIKKPYKDYSFGMKQRLGIAGALLGTPPIAVLDEPANGLDPQGIIDMRAVIKNLHTQSGMTFIISSHILSELDMVANRFGFIDHGVLLQEISREDLHNEAKRSLVIETNDASRAQTVLRSMGIENISMDKDKLILDSDMDRPNEIARALINSGVEIYDLHRRETTLEDYFIRLTGGGRDA